ncbi:unnamed protein product [Ostreobium quekettii]|uniref:Uncharacterized protein n=1 Tax=Ostreobium quekettii TaxID=121088 RepID=A0A8S1J1Q5_9CHLO|nr:unnamed protein product [Ostreobium quekettii]|eukprot:evm.model.scf_236.4 EVM.evm.TU.scf_236.4   scf_236:76950-77825(+)
MARRGEAPVLQHAPVARRKCAKCGVVKPASMFYRNKWAPSGLHHYCRPCEAARQRAYSRARGAMPQEARQRRRHRAALRQREGQERMGDGAKGVAGSARAWAAVFCRRDDATGEVDINVRIPKPGGVLAADNGVDLVEGSPDGEEMGMEGGFRVARKQASGDSAARSGGAAEGGLGMIDRGKSEDEGEGGGGGDERVAWSRPGGVQEVRTIDDWFRFCGPGGLGESAPKVRYFPRKRSRLQFLSRANRPRPRRRVVPSYVLEGGCGSGGNEMCDLGGRGGAQGRGANGGPR